MKRNLSLIVVIFVMTFMGALSVGAFMYQGPTGTGNPIAAGIEFAASIFGEGRSGGLVGAPATRGGDGDGGPAPRPSRGSRQTPGMGPLAVAFPGSVANFWFDDWGHGFEMPGIQTGWPSGFSGKNWTMPTYPASRQGGGLGVGSGFGGAGGGAGGSGDALRSPWTGFQPSISLVELPWVVEPGGEGMPIGGPDSNGGDAPVHAPEPSSLLLCGTALALLTRRMLKGRSSARS